MIWIILLAMNRFTTRSLTGQTTRIQHMWCRPIAKHSPPPDPVMRQAAGFSYMVSAGISTSEQEEDEWCSDQKAQDNAFQPNHNQLPHRHRDICCKDTGDSRGKE